MPSLIHATVTVNQDGSATVSPQPIPVENSNGTGIASIILWTIENGSFQTNGIFLKRPIVGKPFTNGQPQGGAKNYVLVDLNDGADTQGTFQYGVNYRTLIGQDRTLDPDIENQPPSGGGSEGGDERGRGPKAR